MNNCAVICEYNPFHSGHKYQIEHIRELSVDRIFCIMSGSFIQSAMPAFCDKSLRAECAVACGADAVIELPTVFCTASAHAFAEGGLRIVKDICGIRYLAMGATAEKSDILRIAEVKINHADEFEKRRKDFLRCGKSYNFATVSALCEIVSLEYPEHSTSVEKIFTDPNNILCIEYIEAINKFAPNIEPLIIPRLGTAYNDRSRHGVNISATAIRSAESDGDFDSGSDYIPHGFEKIKKWRAAYAPNIDAYKKILMYAVKTMPEEQISALRHSAHGMEFLIKKAARIADLDILLNSEDCKKYGKKRLMRLFYDAAVGINKNITGNKFVTRLLSCKKDFDFTALPQFVLSDNASIKSSANSDAEIRSVLETDERATALFNTVCGIDGDYYNYSLIKV